MILSIAAEIFSNLISLIEKVPFPLLQTISSQIIVWHGAQTDFSLDTNPALPRSFLRMLLDNLLSIMFLLIPQTSPWNVTMHMFCRL